MDEFLAWVEWELPLLASARTIGDADGRRYKLIVEVPADGDYTAAKAAITATVLNTLHDPKPRLRLSAKPLAFREGGLHDMRPYSFWNEPVPWASEKPTHVEVTMMVAQ